ncbi:MAG: hypothetical protein AB7V58_10465 [Solirubrobacterales bacterium]
MAPRFAALRLGLVPEPSVTELQQRAPAAGRIGRWLPRAVLAFAVGLLAFGSTTAAAAPSNSFFHAVSRLDSALRTAIERQPEGLLKSLAASERICSLGEGAEARAEAAAAAADWSTLQQAVELLDRPGLGSVERGFAEATSTLRELEATFSRSWRGQSARLRLLHVAAAQVRRGIRLALASFDPLRQAFSAWLEHHCEAALAASASSTQQARVGVAVIVGGMERLWVLPAVARQMAHSPA